MAALATASLLVSQVHAAALNWENFRAQTEGGTVALPGVRSGEPLINTTVHVVLGETVQFEADFFGTSGFLDRVGNIRFSFARSSGDLDSPATAQFSFAPRGSADVFVLGFDHTFSEEGTWTGTITGREVNTSHGVIKHRFPDDVESAFAYFGVTFIVSSAPVPAPAAGGLGAAGLLALAARRRR